MNRVYSLVNEYRLLGVMLETHETHDHGTSAQLWAPSWAVYVMGSKHSIRARRAVIMQLLNDPLAQSLVRSHPETLDRLLAEAQERHA